MKLQTFLISILVLAVSFTATAQSNTAKMEYFGEKIKAKKAISYERLLQKMDKDGGARTTVRGKVQSVCQHKGCWMTIVSEDPTKPVMFVKFKDYGFFVPKDIQGKEVIMKGEAYYEETSVKELQHYAEDEGKSQAEIDAITEPKRELKFLASGVIVLH